MASRSRWLVGSSRISASDSSTRSRASATRLACPPDSSSVRASSMSPIPSRWSIASPCHPAPTASRTVPAGSCGVWSSTPTRTPRPHRTVPPSLPRSRSLRREGARQHPQQRALAAAVDADDTDPVAVGDRDRDVGEQRPVGAAGGEAFGVDQDHRGGEPVEQLGKATSPGARTRPGDRRAGGPGRIRTSVGCAG